MSRKKGAPTKLTLELTAAICEGLELCLTLEDAAQRAGVARTTVFMWQQKGREQERGAYRDFVDAIDAAKGKRRFRINTQMVSHSKKHWQALAWLAERTDPTHYGLRLRVQVNDQLERVYDKLERGLTPQEYERALQILAEPDDSSEALGEDPRSTSASRRGLSPGVGAAVDAALSESDTPE